MGKGHAIVPNLLLCYDLESLAKLPHVEHGHTLIATTIEERPLLPEGAELPLLQLCPAGLRGIRGGYVAASGLLDAFIQLSAVKHRHLLWLRTAETDQTRR